MLNVLPIWKYFVSHQILIKLGDVVVHMAGYYNISKFHQNLMKNKIVLHIIHLMHGPFIGGKWIWPWNGFLYFMFTLIEVHNVGRYAGGNALFLSTLRYLSIFQAFLHLQKNLSSFLHIYLAHSVFTGSNNPKNKMC